MKKQHLTAALIAASIILFLTGVTPSLYAATKTTSAAFILLSDHSKTLSIGDEFTLFTVTSNLKRPTFKSSKPSVASVNTYGKITAKKAGTCTITAKISGAEATCRITVRKTQIRLNKTSLTLEVGETQTLTAVTSNHSSVTWKSKGRSIASVDENGQVTAKKPGTTTITATADKTSVTCRVKVKTPTVKLNHTKITLSRRQMFQLHAKVSSGRKPTWKSSRKSIATVDSYGMVKAVKHGTCTITATIDGVSRTCEVTVQSPTISLNAEEITLLNGETFQLKADVSSGNSATFHSGNSSVATVSDTGKIKALKKGKATIYASEDGTKERCIVYVVDKDK